MKFVNGNVLTSGHQHGTHERNQQPHDVFAFSGIKEKIAITVVWYCVMTAMNTINK